MAENQTLPLQFSHTFFSHETEQELPLNISAEHPKKVLQDKNNEMNKAFVPIKQYSNKFLRNMTFKAKGEPPHRKLNIQQRFNVILKKKNVFNKYLPKENHMRLEQHSIESNHENQALIKVSRLYKSKKDNIKTQASTHNIENNLSNIQLLDPSLFTLIAPTSNLLNTSTKSRFFDENHREVEVKKNKSIPIKTVQKKQKISQSRGLELFSKIFVRNKDEIFEKIQKKFNHQKPIASKFYQTEPNFQTRKITPLQKDRKAKILVETFRPKKKSVQKYYTIENGEDNEQFFELNGWETAI